MRHAFARGHWSAVVPLLVAAACAGEDRGPSVVALLPPSGVASRAALVDFGTVKAGQTHSRTLVLRNDGDAEARITGWARADGTRVASLPAPFSFEPGFPIALAPGEARATFVRFAPAEETRGWKFEFALRVDGRAQAEWPALTLLGRTGPLPCELEIDPPALDFGTVPELGGVVSAIEIRNAAADPLATCAVSDLRLDPGTDERLMFQVEPPAFATLRPGEKVTAQILALAGAPARAEGTGGFAFEATGAGTATVRVPIRAHFPADCVAVSPSILAFPPQGVCGGFAEGLVSLRNTCPRPVEVTSIRITEPVGLGAGEPGCPGPASCPEFTLAHAPTAPVDLDPEESVVVPVRFTPLSWGDIRGELRIGTLYGVQPGRIDVPLVAREPRQDTVDVFENAEAPGIDVLVVLDNGMSMLGREQDLQWNFERLFDRADALCADLNLGMIFGDISPSAPVGRLITTPTAPAVLNWITTPSFRQLGMSKLMMPPSPISVPGPMEAMARALTPPLATGANAGFLREEARLVTIIVTDRRDQSTSAALDYAQLLHVVEGTAPQPPRVEIVAGFLGAGACGAEEDDGRFKELALAHGGQTTSVCDSNWRLLNLVRTWPCDVHRVRYPLSAPPAHGPGTIAVAVDEVDVPATSETGERNWVYDPAANEVIFARPPGAGKVVELSYASLCGR